MDISVILATYKRPEILSKTLESFCRLETGDLKWELIIADNADDADTQNVVANYSGRLPLKLIIEPKPGKNNALNSALPEAAGELFVFTDDDIIAEPDWLMELWSGTGRWPQHSVFGGKIIAGWPDGEPPQWGADHLLNISLFALHEPYDKEMLYGENDFLPYGPNMAIRKKIFDLNYKYNPDVGPTNKAIYKMGSETELLMRLRADGFIPVYLPACVVQHQIRPEQLSKTWLKRRNFRIGFYDASPEEKLDRKLFSSGLYLWKRILQLSLKTVLMTVLGNQLKAFEAQCQFYRVRGKIYAQRYYHGIEDNKLLQKILRIS